MDRSKQLGEGNVGKLLLKFSIPAIVGMLVNALYNIVDRIFVGHAIGLLGISAITVAFPIAIIIMAFGMLVGIGSAAVISIKLGQEKKAEAEKILGNAFTLIIIISILVTLLGLVFLDPLLRMFGASKEVFSMAKEYTTIVLLGSILQSIGFGLNNSIRSEGNPKKAMYTMLIGAILNCIFNAIFIFGMDLGISGAALGTIVSQSICTIWVLYYFTKGNSTLKLKKTNLKLDFNIMKQIFAIGMSPFLMQLASSVVNIILNKRLVTFGGDTAIGAMGIINSIAMLILMPIIGINQGAQPIIGYNYGAENFKRVKDTLKWALLGATIISTTGFLFVEFFPEVLIGLFNKTDEGLMNIGVRGMRIFLMMLPIIGFQVVSSNYFQAVGKAKIAIFLSLSRQVIILLPLLLILPQFFKLDGVWMAGPVADFIASLITGIFLFSELKKLEEKYELEDVEI